MATGFYQVATGAFPLTKVLPSTILGIILIVLLSYSYLNARSLDWPSRSKK